MLNFGIDQNLLAFKRNPFAKTFIKEGKKKRKILTETQINDIIKLFECDKIPPILRPSWFMLAIINTFRYTGIRRSQLIQLRVKDIDLKRKVIIIPPRINKNHNYHEIPIANKLLPHLRKLIYEIQLLTLRDDEQLFNLNLFSNVVLNKHSPMTFDQLKHIFEVISNLVGFKVSPHRFRHTIATRLMRKPENLYNVQKLLNHSDVKVTLSYIDYDCEMIRDCVDTL